MKLKKIFLLALMFLGFSISTCIAMEFILHNPYKNVQVKMRTRYKNIDNSLDVFRIDEDSMAYKFQEKHIHVELAKANFVSFKIELVGQFNSKQITIAQQSYNSHQNNLLGIRAATETFSFNNQEGEIAYTIEVRNKGSEIEFLDLNIREVTIDGVELALKDEL